jgi:hypothetical protein
MLKNLEIDSQYLLHATAATGQDLSINNCCDTPSCTCLVYESNSLARGIYFLPNVIIFHQLSSHSLLSFSQLGYFAPLITTALPTTLIKSTQCSSDKRGGASLFTGALLSNQLDFLRDLYHHTSQQRTWDEDVLFLSHTNPASAEAQSLALASTMEGISRQLSTITTLVTTLVLYTTSLLALVYSLSRLPRFPTPTFVPSTRRLC